MAEAIGHLRPPAEEPQRGQARPAEARGERERETVPATPPAVPAESVDAVGDSASQPGVDDDAPKEA
jgi:hypothetical protein